MPSHVGSRPDWIEAFAGYGARNENFVLVLPNSDLSDLAPVGCVATFDAPCSIDDWCVEERNAPYAGISRAPPLASYRPQNGNDSQNRTFVSGRLDM